MLERSTLDEASKVSSRTRVFGSFSIVVKLLTLYTSRRPRHTVSKHIHGTRKTINRTPGYIGIDGQLWNAYPARHLRNPFAMFSLILANFELHILCSLISATHLHTLYTSLIASNSHFLLESKLLIDVKYAD